MPENHDNRHEPQTAEELSHERPSKAAAVHELIREEGEKELRRDFFALFWSAMAAGLTMSMSMLGTGVLQAYLPDASWGPLIGAMGYSLGFIFVIMAGQQLFSENTLTPVLPFMSAPSLAMLLKVLRLWGTVLLGNMLGGALAAAIFAFLPMFSPEVQKSFHDLGQHLIDQPVAKTTALAALAGWLIATLVWMLSAVERGRLALIFLVTYTMGIVGASHVVSGAIEVLYIVFLGQLSFSDGLARFILPCLAGNVIGGTFIFALISHAQVRADIT